MISISHGLPRRVLNAPYSRNESIRKHMEQESIETDADDETVVLFDSTCRVRRRTNVRR